MAEDYEVRRKRQEGLRSTLAEKENLLRIDARTITRLGIEEVIKLIDDFTKVLKEKKSTEASTAYETLMRKVHSLEAGLDAATKIAAVFSGVQTSFVKGKNALYTIGCSMRESQNVVIGKPQIEDDKSVEAADRLCVHVKELLELALKCDADDWTVLCTP